MKSPFTPENIPGYILALAKDMYNHLFDWIVKKMNRLLKGDIEENILNDSTLPLPHNIRTIGILDIFGFEIFDNNYLE